MNLSGTLETVLIRHGQTEGNVNGIVQGQSDTPLTKEGIVSTMRKANKIRRLRFDAAYCSDLQRAVRTYEILKEHLPELPEPTFDAALREIDFGDLSGRLKQEIMPVILRHKANRQWRYPNGESGAVFIERVRAFFLKLMETHVGRKVLVVSHYGVMETAEHEFAGTPREKRIIIGPDEVWAMTFNSGPTATKDVL